MHQQINSWSLRGYIFVLGKIRETDLKSIVSDRAGKISVMFVDQNDHKLAVMMAETVKNGEIESVVMLPFWTLQVRSHSFNNFIQQNETKCYIAWKQQHV